ncbi:exo-alpha-sialidase [Bacteroides xylanisolvens]|jgi:hypothetical protein|uniref:Exo-alpha-sialidase n=2 Tax=Bacteroides xylanisolvens TaxID=371601 RepID=A0A415KZM0_9BACE|nr:exo-alpha-sialidase [Bacteroides xylanisolvens]RHL41723.1 exo-alpha-sialidase [Bacteroides xylanisolvens]RYT19830.1 exo-alpha-sialidase [Bacteroides xylanisolvens]
MHIGMGKILKNMIKSIGLALVAMSIICCGEHEFGQFTSVVEETSENFPGTIVCHYKKSSRIYPSSPSICILPNGDYLISCEEGGPNCPVPKVTHIFKSTDKGDTWDKIASITNGQAWSNLFLYEGAVYIMGVDAPSGNVVIRKSTDNGTTWTSNVSSDNGLIFTGKYHTAPVPVVVHNNRIWRAMECYSSVISGWPKEFCAMMMSAPVGSDLMKATSWQQSNSLPYNSTYLNGYFGGWLEGNAVVGPDGKMKLIMRVEVPASVKEEVAIIDVSDDGTQISFNPETGFAQMPGGAKKFTIRYDEATARYWTLSNNVRDEFFTTVPGNVRNSLVLCSSKNLREWEIHEEVLFHEDVKYHAFQYIDWHVDGNDIVFVSRTSYDDKYGGADSYHNANYCTFHRVENFRKYISQ